MLIRKWLLTTVICGGLLAATGMAQSAEAAGVLQPNSDWAVSKLAANKTGGQPYCALARRYSNDLILTLARNAKDESSVAIDFQKPALNNTQSYRVSLQPGFGQDRAFNVRPVSGKALVIRLGKDYAFYDALNRSGQLTVDISGESYSFNLPGFDDGQKKLGACLVNLVEPAAGGGNAAAAPVTPLPPPAQYRSSYLPATDTAPQAPVVSRQQDAGGDVQALREENLRLRNALERERRNYEDRYLREGQTSSMAAEMSEKVRILEMENGQLRQQLAYKPVPQDMTCPAPDNTGNVALESEITQLRDDNLRLKQDIAAQQARNGLLEKQIAEKAVPDEAETAVMDSLRARVSKLEEENKSLKMANESLKKGGGDVPVSLAQLRSVEEQLRLVEQDRNRLLQQINAVNDGKGEGLLDISSDNWDLEQATRRFNEAEREIRRLARQLEESRTQCAVEKKSLEYMLFDPEVAKEEQISKLIELEDKVNNAAAIFDEERAGYEEKIASLSEQAGAAQSTLDIQRAEYEQKLGVLEQELASRGDVSADAQNRIAMLERRLADKEGTSAQTQGTIAMLQRELEEARFAALQTADGDVALRQELEVLANRKMELEVENSRLGNRLAALESEFAAIETAAGSPVQDPAADARLAALAQENNELIHERNMLEQERNVLIEKESMLNQKVASLESALASIPTGAGPGSPPPAVVAEPVAMHGGGYEQDSYPYQDFGTSVDQTVAPAVSSAAGMITVSALQGVLGAAQIPVQGGVEQVERAADFVAYSWDTGVLFGSAEQQPLGDLGRFDAMAQDYLGKTKARCQGDFAAVPVMAEQVGSMRVSSYEIACISGAQGAAASIVFYNDGGLFTTIAHETGLEGMDAAMDVRDRLTSTLMQTQVASY